MVPWQRISGIRSALIPHSGGTPAKFAELRDNSGLTILRKGAWKKRRRAQGRS